MVTKHVNRQKVDTEKIEGHAMTYFYKHGSRVGLEINCIDSVEVALCFVIFSPFCNISEKVQLDRLSMPWSLETSWLMQSSR